MPIKMVHVPVSRPGVYGFTTVLFNPSSKISIRHLATVLGLEMQTQCKMPGYRYTVMTSDGDVLHVGNTKSTALYLESYADGFCRAYRLAWKCGVSK